ncbi:MAG: hypothetical protein KDE31_32715, partial [Caldilineaceae bacterium]|nr:hypothetical protein [Caldilineaceae bacterium]
HQTSIHADKGWLEKNRSTKSRRYFVGSYAIANQSELCLVTVLSFGKKKGGMPNVSIVNALSAPAAIDTIRVYRRKKPRSQTKLKIKLHSHRGCTLLGKRGCTDKSPAGINCDNKNKTACISSGT